MSRTVGRRLLSRVQNLGFLADDVLRDNLATVPGIKPRQVLSIKTFFPARDEILAAGVSRLSRRSPKFQPPLKLGALISFVSREDRRTRLSLPVKESHAQKSV
jgi:hypothetical protein